MSDEADRVRAADPAALRAVAVTLRSTATAVRQQAIGVAAIEPTGWSGRAAHDAAVQADRLAARGLRLAQQLQDAAAALLTGAHGVEAAQRLLAAADRLAAERPSDPVAGRPLGAQLVAARPPGAELPEVQQVRARALADYRLAAAELAARLREVGMPRAGMAGAGMPGAGPPVPSPVGAPPAGGLPSPAPADPAAVATWWAGLTAEQREWLIRERPESVGPADGLPAEARDRANRTLLADAEALLLDRLATTAASAPDADDTLDRLRAVANLRQLLETRDGRVRQLLAFDPGGDFVTAAVSTGDVDAAGSLAIFVPGFTATVSTHLLSYAGRVQGAADLATRMAGESGPVVGVVWLGYITPQVSGVLTPGRTVLGLGPAQDGAARLDRFLSGLAAASRAAPPPPGALATLGTLGTPAGRAVRAPAPPPRLVLWAHSYGSTVAGLMLARGHPPVDALVTAGSPGLTVSDVTRLGLPPGRVYAAEALGDPVAEKGAFGADVGHLDGVTLLATGARTLPDGTVGVGISGHVDYLEAGSTSAWNLAAVAAGRPDLLVTTPRCDSVSAFAPMPAGCRGTLAR